MVKSQHQISGGKSFQSSLGITDQGLVCGVGSALVRMAERQNSAPRLALNEEAGRLLAMLSVAFGRSVAPDEIIPHVEAASNYWFHGEKVLANFRLIFVNLPKLRDRTDADRLRLAEYVLDRGVSPDDLVNELGLAQVSVALKKYREDEPRVPAGSGSESGRWTDATTTLQTPQPTQKPILLAEEDEREEDDKLYEERRLTGQTTRIEDLEHGRGGPLRVPQNIGPGPFAATPIPAGPGPRPSQSQSVEITAKGKVDGCHTCGTKDPGSASGMFFCDHQPPTSLLKPGEKQYYYPHCQTCSCRQGGLVRSFKARGR